MTCRGAPAERGFTLLEILVAVTLLGLLMAALFGGVQLGVRAWEASGTRLDDSARLTAVQDFLRERLTQAYEIEGAGAGPGAEGQPAFLGEPDRLSFVTLMPDHLGAGFQHMILALTAADDGADLALTWWPLPTGPDASAQEEVRSRVLLAHVAELQLAYFGAIDPEQPPGWYDLWDQPRLPQLVRVRLRFPDRAGPGWPDLIVRPMIDGQPS